MRPKSKVKTYYLVPKNRMSQVVGQGLTKLEEKLLSTITERNITESEKLTLLSDLLREHSAPNLSWILPLIPKSLQSKAKILLHSIRDKVKVDQDGQAILPTGQNLGSILDLIKYTISPPHIQNSDP